MGTRASKNVQDLYPLTPLQQGILYHSAEAAGSTAPYLFQLCFRLRGELDAAALEQAFQAVIARHDLLRCDIQWQKSKQPVQIVYREVVVQLQRQDLSGCEECEIDKRIQALLREDRARGFDFARAADPRLLLIKLKPREHLLLWTYHHVTLDGWSVGNVLGEVLTVYTATRQGSAPNLREVPPYATYLEYLRGRDENAAEHHFRQVLAGYETPLEFPPIGHSSRDVEQRFAEQRVSFNALESEQIRAAARRFRVTLNTYFQGVWALLTCVYTGREEAVFGATLAGRPSEIANADAMVGMFINTLPVRIVCPRGQSFEEFLHALQDQNARLRQVEYASLPKVAKWSGVRGTLPLFESIVVFENYPIDSVLERVERLELQVEVYEPEQRLGGGASATRRRNNFPLSLIVLPGGEVEAALCYHCDRIQHATMASMCAVFRALALGSSESRAFSLDEALRIGRAACEPALESLQPPPRAFESVGVHRRVEAQARAHPERCAVQFEQDRLRYHEFDQRASSLARRLHQSGVRSGHAVGVCMARSADAVVALLAVLKCGAVYVPLDPAHPPLRLRALLTDAGAHTLVTRSELRGALSDLGAALVVADDPELALEVEPFESASVHAESPAYLIYTSGSTGKPKGVAVSHRALESYVDALLERLALPADASLGLVSTLAADVGHTALFGALCSGRTLHLIATRRAFDSEAFGAYMQAHQVDVLKIVPSHLSGLMQAGDPGCVLPRHTLILGGEASSWELVERIRHHGDCRILNHYGPTETTVGVLTYGVPAKPAVGSKTLPLGTPLTNSRVYVLNRDLSPVPVGAVGEIHIGGRGVAQQYLKEPRRTAERFVPDPRGAPGARLYRTGDRARVLEDGSLEFLGRADDQVKVRGHRVELGEVRAALRSLPQVVDAEVLLRGASNLHERLVAYAVGAEVQEPAVREQLAGLLPEPMQPGEYVWLERLPLTPNGKVDRSALKTSDPTPNQATPAKPRDEQERSLLAVWREVLKREDIGVDDHFFRVGGDSLLAFQIVALARKAGIALAPSDLFEHPTVAALSARLKQTAVEQTVDEPRLEPVSRGEPLPLSHAQERLWFLWKLQPEGGGYNVPKAVKLTGELDRGFLEASFSRLCARHESLRTRFLEQDARVWQVIDPPAPFSLTFMDLSELEPGAREERARALQREEANRPFDLARGPLLRATLVKLSTLEHVLLVTLHHIVSDGQSLDIFIRELSALYAAELAHEEVELAPLAVQYADFAWYQRRLLSTEDSPGAEERARLLAYWHEQLGSDHAPLALPFDFARPRLPSQRAATHRMEMAPELARGLRELARERGVTLFTLLLAAFKLLLHRYTAQRDIRVGVPHAGRAHADLEGVIGCFVDMQVLRTQIDPEQSFVRLLERVRDVAIEAHVHRALPFELLVESLNPTRSLNHNPLFQVLYDHQRREDHPFHTLGVLQLESYDLGTESTPFDLTLSTLEEGERLWAQWTYSADLFAPETVEHMARSYQTLLAEILNSPDQRNGTIPLLDVKERSELLVLGHGPGRAFEQRDAPLHRWFEAQVERTPEACAVVGEEEELTYRTLDAEANRLALQLVESGVRRGSLVGVCLERSPRLLASLLAILKAGGAYVPIDPEHPVERIAYVISDSGLPVLLTQESLRVRVDAALSSERSVRVLMLEELAQAAHVFSANNLNGPSHPFDLAYCIYTSGSTGQPKAVSVHHGALVNFLQAMGERLAQRAGARVLAHTSLSFDISALELFWPLVSGATVVIVSRKVASDVDAMLQCVRDQRITHLQATPSTFQMLCHAPAFCALPPCELLVGGEELPQDLAQRLIAQVGDATNLYGPTEATVWSTAQRLDGEHARVGLGKPLANTQAHVLDARLSPVPVGATGEIYLGGAGVARGYHRRPGLTAERFVPDPWSARAGDRLYRTGDLARRRTDGSLDFLGRADAQVKLRGHRIELGEIEASLREHPQVRDAAAAVRTLAADDQRLVAYVVPWRAVAEESAEASQLREALTLELGERLPSHMLPSAYVWLERLPLSSNGKLDRAALPTPVPRRSQAHVAPRTPLERTITTLWAELLQAPEIGIDESFFARGGHSLLAVRAMQALSAALGRPLALALAFEHQTPRALAAALEGSRNTVTARTLVPLEASGDRAPLYCLHPAGGHTLSYRVLAQRLRGVRPVYGVQAKSFYLEHWTDRSITEMATHYAQEIMERSLNAPVHLFGWSFGAVLAIEVARVLEQQSATLGFVGLVDATGLLPTSEGQTTHAATAASREVLSAWAARAHLREKWQALLERADMATERWLGQQFVQRDLENRQLDWAEESELFSGANSLMLTRDYRLHPIETPVHAYWARESLHDRSLDATQELQAKLTLASNLIFDGDHFSIVSSAALCDAVGQTLRTLRT